MTQFDINFNSAEQIRADLDNVSKHIKERLNQLNNDTHKALQAWGGDAFETYKVRRAKWNAAADQMPQALNKATTVLQGIIDGYKRNERVNASSWGG